jgi:hypothetical protein
MIDQINRLGFEAWADNIIVNKLEDVKGLSFHSMSILAQDYSLTMSRCGDSLVAVVRAWVPGTGWQTCERTIKAEGVL